MRRINKSSNSVGVAKERLKTLLVSDRIECRPDTYELLCNDLYRTISKYLKVEKQYFNVDVSHANICIKLVGDES